jgi:hypothetical protein
VGYVLETPLTRVNVNRVLLPFLRRRVGGLFWFLESAQPSLFLVCYRSCGGRWNSNTWSLMTWPCRPTGMSYQAFVCLGNLLCEGSTEKASVVRPMLLDPIHPLHPGSWLHHAKGYRSAASPSIHPFCLIMTGGSTSITPLNSPGLPWRTWRTRPCVYGLDAISICGCTGSPSRANPPGCRPFQVCWG